MVLIKISPALDLMVPPGISNEEARMALATLLSVSCTLAACVPKPQWKSHMGVYNPRYHGDTAYSGQIVAAAHALAPLIVRSSASPLSAI